MSSFAVAFGVALRNTYRCRSPALSVCFGALNILYLLYTIQSYIQQALFRCICW